MSEKQTLADRCKPYLHEAEGFTEKLPYRLMVPENFDPEKEKLPLLVFIHGMGSVGTDNLLPLNGPSVPLIADYLEKYGKRAVFLFPQSPCAWVDTDWRKKSHRMKKEPTQSFGLLLNLIKKLVKDLKLDKNRLYLTGNSMGGFCSWELIQRTGNMFAGALIVCGGGDPKADPGIVPVWCTHGDADPEVSVSRSRDMVKHRKGENIILSEYPGMGHNVWEATYANRAYFDWLFARRRKK